MGTRRQEIAEALEVRELTARQLALELHVRMTDLLADLEHVARSHRRRLRVRPARCQDCGFVFAARRRLSSPSRCPKCRSERTEGPYMRIR